MRRRRCLGAALAALFCCSAPVHAQDALPAPVPVRCAVWAALAADYTSKPEEEDALRLAFIYFVGLAEGQTGKLIGDVMTPALVEREAHEMDQLDRICSPLMADMGKRLSGLGGQLEPSPGEDTTDR